jgi:hypothetical protein
MQVMYDIPGESDVPGAGYSYEGVTPDSIYAALYPGGPAGVVDYPALASPDVDGDDMGGGAGLGEEVTPDVVPGLQGYMAGTHDPDDVC